MHDKVAVPFYRLQGTLEDLEEDLAYYTNITGDEQAKDAHQRLLELLTQTMQKLAACIIDAAIANPDLTPADIVESLRDTAEQIVPSSVVYYEPLSDWDDDE